MSAPSQVNMTIQIPDAFVFMKAGPYVSESLESILERKQREIAQTGRTFWGYGGSQLHPITQMQPFAKAQVQRQGELLVLMPITSSKTDTQIRPAVEFSVDRHTWKPIPPGICVTEALFALVMDELKPIHMELDLGQYEVGIGDSKGRNAAKFIRGHVSKGCFVATHPTVVDPDPPSTVVKVALEARLVAPYAVFVRR